MNSSADDLGVITVLLQRLETQRLPRTLAIKGKVDQGGVLDDSDIAFFEEVFADSAKVMHLVDKHPEYQQLAGNLLALYNEITEKALINQNNGAQ